MIRILVVDDDIGRTGIMDSLIDDLRAEQHFRVAPASSVEDAEKMLLKEERRFDVVVLDIMMPYGR